MASDRAPTLVALAREFNFAPANYVDPSWLPAEWAENFTLLRASLHTRALDVVSRWLLQQHGLEQDYDFDFSATEKRVALLDRPAFAKLARYLGLCAHARSVRSLVERGAVTALIGKLGREAYDFAVLRATSPAKPAPRINPSDDGFVTQLTGEGSRRLFGLLNGGSSAVLRRARLKLPRDAVPTDALPFSDEEQAETRRLVLTHLIPELEPRWVTLF